MADNLHIWNTLGRTDPVHTKGFKRGGGFSGTAVKPIYTEQKMTEVFGPAGKGWGMGEPSFQTVAGSDGQVAVYCTVPLWWIGPDDADGTVNTVYGVGGDMVVIKQSSGLRTDDEAFKKAFTDAVGNAMKHLGMSADVHMGRFDDSKYVSEVRAEIEAEAAQKPASKAQSRPVYERLSKANKDCADRAAFDRLWTHHKTLEAYASLPADWREHLDEEKADKAAELDERAAMQADDPNAQFDRMEREAAE